MKKRAAFTLIEILIVIMIVGVMTILVIANFGVTRQRARMELVADTIVTTIKQQQNLAKSGRGLSPQCYGVFFDAENSEVMLITAPYISINIGEDYADYCDMKSKDTTESKISVLENFKIAGIDAFNKQVNSYLIMFRPPEANISVGETLENPTILQNQQGLAMSDSEIKIIVESSDKIEKRQIIFDVSTGRAEKIKPEEIVSNEKSK
jgi:prepilin-type N-terminal cleavage/methylation domain-containing protein